MKKLLFLLWFYPTLLFGQTSADTAQTSSVLRVTANLGQRITTLNQSVSVLTARTDTLTQRIDKSLKPSTCTFCQSELSSGQRWLVAMPLLLFILTSVYVLSRLRLEGYKLSDALRENYVVNVSNTSEGVTSKLDAQKALEAQGVAADVAKAASDGVGQIRPQSTSRLIAFFSGMAAVIVSVSSVSFFFYVYLRTGQQPSFESLWNVVLGLDVGVVPYAFNRLSEALNPK